MPAALVTDLRGYPNADGSTYDMELTVIFQHASISGRRRVESFGANIDLTPANFYSSMVAAVVAHAQNNLGVTFNNNQVAVPQYIRGS